MKLNLPVAVTMGLFSCMAVAQQAIRGGAEISLPSPPPTRVAEVTDIYASSDPSAPTKITDPYRWLEDAKSAETRAFIDAQNAYTRQYLAQVKIRPQIVEELTRLQRIDEISVPTHRGDKYFFIKRLADENQGSVYMRKGLNGSDERLVDATRLSADQNTSVSIRDVSEDGSLLVYGIRVGGADEDEIHVLDLRTGKELADQLPSARYSGVRVAPGSKGLYYAKFFPHEGSRAFYHGFGTALDSDAMIFGREYKGEKLGEIDLVGVNITDNGHYLIVSLAHGVPAKRQDILVKDLRKPDAPLVPLVYGIEAQSSSMNIGDDFYLSTNYQAPNRRIVKVEPGAGPETWKTVIAEGKDVIESASIVGGKLFVTRLKDVKTQTTIYTLEGKQTGTIEYPGIGNGSNVSGRPKDSDGFYVFQSFNVPPTIYRYDTQTGKTDVFAASKVPFDQSKYEVTQVFYTSKDGTRVPMFIVGKKGLKRDGTGRLLMTGYGGFDLGMTPAWNAEYAWWIEQGGFFAMPNLRGGNEYGEAWHKAAMFEKKQNVFDDWFAAAEYLIANHYTTPARFAIRGRSNGGLLMGASMTQRPDLFGAIWCGYPLLDMLRYQKFLMGRTWTTEYGSAENPGDYPYILKYSPYQNVKPGTKYPAIMFFTGDGDTRVDPMNARKMTPLMQTASASGRPVLLHYSVKGGHSAGVSITQLVEDQADELSFLWTETSSK